jgi:KDO2-lipid IV(A) lauroyltransferase
MAGASDPPPPWGLLGNDEKRRAARRYWIRDPLVGATELTIHAVMRLLTIDMCSWCGALLTYLTRHFYPESELRARKVWAALRPDEADPASIDRAMNRLWRNVGRTMHEYSILDRLWAASRIEVSNIEHLDRARDEGRPILVTPLHLGNWEAVLVAGIACGHHGSGIYMPPENRFERLIADAARERYGARFRTAGPHSLREAVRELRGRKGPFIIYIDECIRGRVQSPLFGERSASIAISATLHASPP